jgi:hypothetical protein
MTIPNTTLRSCSCLIGLEPQWRPQTSNADGLALLGGSRYDVVISDAAHDNEGPESNFKGLEFAEQVFNGWGIRVLFFIARLDLAIVPGKTDKERPARQTRSD